VSGQPGARLSGAAGGPGRVGIARRPRRDRRRVNRAIVGRRRPRFSTPARRRRRRRRLTVCAEVGHTRRMPPPAAAAMLLLPARRHGISRGHRTRRIIRRATESMLDICPNSHLPPSEYQPLYLILTVNSP